MQGRRWVLKRHGETIEVVAPRQHGLGHRVWPQIFQWAFADPEARADLLDIFQYLGGRLPGRMSDRQLREMVERRLEEGLRSGAIGIWSDKLAAFGGGSHSPPPSGVVPEPTLKSEPKTAGEDEDKAPVTKSQKTWIEIRLVDQDNEPVGKRKFRLKLTDGTTKEGELDADGSVRVSGIDPGDCEFTLLDLDGKEWGPQ